MVAAQTSPDWFGSPQHFIGGLVLGIASVLVLGRLVSAPKLVLVVLAVGIVCISEILIEIVEYPLLYSDSPGVSDYYDTLADLAATLVGGIVGAGGTVLSRRTRVEP